MEKMAPRSNITPPHLEAALKYAELGWSVLPTRTDSKRPAVHSWLDYQKKKLSPADLSGFWRENPNFNVGAVTGQISGISVVDLDGKHAPALLKAADIALPVTRTHRTPSGGFHYFYAYDRRFKTGSRLLEAGDECQCVKDGKPTKCGVDVRNDGGFIVLPPSVYDGKGYTVAR